MINIEGRECCRAFEQNSIVTSASKANNDEGSIAE